MTESTGKKISRRDAIKILGAVAGASVLVNLPNKWSKPFLASGVLPAHAQTSVAAPAAAPIAIASLTCNLDITIVVGGGAVIPWPAGTFGATIAPAAAGISVNYVMAGTAGITAPPPPPLIGTLLTDAAGFAGMPAMSTTNTITPSTLTFTFSVGGFTCTQTLQIN